MSIETRMNVLTKTPQPRWRVGLIYFGLPRCSRMTIPAIEKHILHELRDCDVFIQSCFSYQTSIANARSGEQGDILDVNYEYFRQYSHLFISPEHLLDEVLYAQLLAQGDMWHDGGRSLRNLLLQLASLKQAYQALGSLDCDFFLFVRPDLFIHEPIPIRKFMHRYQGKNAILLPSWQWHKGVNDRFAVATPAAANAFATRYDFMLDYCKETSRALHSERFLAHQLKLHQVKVKTCATKMTRVRINGEFVEEVFSTNRRMGGLKFAVKAQLSQVGYLRILSGLLGIAYFYIQKGVKSLGRRFKS